MYKLIIEDDEGKTTVVPLIRDEISIGRKEGNTIRLTERNVSRRHAKLVKQNGAVFIEDLDSYCGIKVNGNRISGRVAVAEGDRIQIGDYVLGLKVEGQPAQSKPATAAAAPRPPAASPMAASEAPTAQIDVSGMPAEVAETSKSAGAPARVVCVSSNFAGLEFTLNKPVMVIGRTDDNDVVVNHRSISRHHARIVEENGRYTIIDMQSANGVRVNGEEYGKVELRKADYIDLGHVRLRFVASGEDFVFSRDATVVDPAQVGGSRGAIWVILALIAVVAVGVLLWKLMGKPDDPKQPGTGSGSVTTTPGTGTSAPVEDQTELLNKLNGALDRQDWGQALKYCADLLGEAKVSSKDNCERASSELAAKKLFDDASAAATRNEHKKALELFMKIPKASTYYQEREKSATFLDAKKKYLAQVISELDDTIKNGDCKAAKKKVVEIRAMVPDAPGLDEKLDNCKKAPGTVAAVPPTKKPKRRIKPVHVRKVPVHPKKPAGLTPQQKADLQPLGSQAVQAYLGNNWARAMALGQKYLKGFPNDQKLLAIVGASACKLNRAGVAKSVYRRLQPARRGMLKQVCQSAKIAVP